MKNKAIAKKTTLEVTITDYNNVLSNTDMEYEVSKVLQSRFATSIMCKYLQIKVTTKSKTSEV